MKLMMMDSDMLDYLKDNACIKENLNKYIDYTNNDWIFEVCEKKPFIETKYNNIPNFSLDMSSERPVETEFENVKRVYSNLSFISDSTATDERLWTALCLGEFYDYVKYRWKIQTEGNVKEHYFMKYESRQSLMRNAISRLWWIGRLTYDKSREDPYELTAVVCESADFITGFLERNISDSLHIIRPAVEAIIECRKEGLKTDMLIVRDMLKYLNLLGGSYILDAMPEEWIKNKMKKRIAKNNRA